MADMEADNMAHEMTPQERAAALLGRMGLCGHPAASQFVGDIIEHDQQTRRAALLEVAELHQEWRNGKHSGTFSDLLRHKLAQEG